MHLQFCVYFLCNFAWQHVAKINPRSHVIGRELLSHERQNRYFVWVYSWNMALSRNIISKAWPNPVLVGTTLLVLNGSQFPTGGFFIMQLHPVNISGTMERSHNCRELFWRERHNFLEKHRATWHRVWSRPLNYIVRYCK